ncbi:hypothetical protein BDN72DRAFT_756432 [Pluteus cervinus]|uniref:Uncharacterized protein n=1 Tax=Pluteus cervinus TaxID=181527 RepID=A0ACD3BEI4_9AGAR|nr:hypothetical protein BDN72DRAFT_756432 [Pluteus cervinus]
MPVDASHTPHARRASRKLNAEEDIELRRARGEISCAECRRLKLKCDKQLPCSSCVRRGCSSICPNGSLSTGQGTRFVLADTTQLHAKITDMGQRIRQLEDALAIMQASASSEPHPLLRDEFLGIKFGIETSNPQGQAHSEPQSELVNAFGTLTVSDAGASKFFGPSGGSEAGAELQAEESTISNDDVPPVPLSADIARLVEVFPSLGSVEQMMDGLFDQLPIQPRAWALCETYLQHVAWSFCPVMRDEIIDEFLTPIYKLVKARQGAGSDRQQLRLSPHRLAVLFMIFALGALYDLTLEPSNDEAENFHLLARAALALKAIYDSPEMATLQAIALMAHFFGMGGQHYSLDTSWVLMSMGAKLAQSVYRDSARWNLDAKIVERRRKLFWEVFSVDTFYSLALGRPPCIRVSYIDCQFPEDDEAKLDQDGTLLPGFYRWKYEFAKEILAVITETTLTAEPPRYQTILELDRKVRGKVLPPHLNVRLGAEDQDCSVSRYFRGCLLGQYRSLALLYIHRSFFAQALLDHPANPLKSPYAPSFLSAYRCASFVIKCLMSDYEKFPDLCNRWWNVWNHLFSAAVIVGSIVTRAPTSTMAPNAYVQLNIACEMFEKAAVHSSRARNGLAILSRLKNRAAEVLAQSDRVDSDSSAILSAGQFDFGDDELALFGGQTRVLVTRLLSTRTLRKVSSPSTSAPSPASSSDDSNRGSTPFTDAEVHPSLVNFLSSLPTGPYPISSDSMQPSGNPLPSQTETMPVDFIVPPAQSSWASIPTSTQDDFYRVPTTLPPQGIFSLNNAQVPHVQSQVVNLDPIYQPNLTMLDYEMVMPGDSGIDEQWNSFMRDSGLLEDFAQMSKNTSFA